MFVKIIEGDGWYRGLEGEVFEITGENDGEHYFAESEEAYETLGGLRLFEMSDCEVVDGPATKYITTDSNEVFDVEHTWHVGTPSRIFAHMPGRTIEIKGASDEDVERSSIEVGVQPGEAVNHPNHYNSGAIETIEIIAEITKGYEDPFVAYCVGNAQKYIARAPHKGKLEEDLEKAAKYIEFALEHIRGDGE